jgi:hypothetical protein
MQLSLLFPTDPEDPSESPRCPRCGSKARTVQDYNYKRINRCPAQGCRAWFEEEA